MFRLKKSKSRGLGKYGANKKYRRVSSRVSASFSAAAQFNNLVIENIFQRFQLAFKMPLASHHLSDFIPDSTGICKNKLQKLEDALVEQMLTSAKCAKL